SPGRRGLSQGRGTLRGRRGRRMVRGRRARLAARRALGGGTFRQLRRGLAQHPEPDLALRGRAHLLALRARGVGEVGGDEWFPFSDPLPPVGGEGGRGGGGWSQVTPTDSAIGVRNVSKH